jgi:hypothetical protein
MTSDLGHGRQVDEMERKGKERLRKDWRMERENTERAGTGAPHV